MKNGKTCPTPELIHELRTVAHADNYRAYRRLVNQIDWNLSHDAELIDEGIGIMIGYGDMKRAKSLTETAHERFPEHEQIARTLSIFHPPPARVVTPKWRESPESALATWQWLDDHAHDYSIGHWLSVWDGQLVADAPSRSELDKILNTLRQNGTLEGPTLIHKVIS